MGERREFNQFMEDLGVEDIPMLGRRYTWLGGLMGKL